MKNLLASWKHQEQKLTDRRKFLSERGSVDGGLEETRIDQQRNNKRYDNITSKANYRRAVGCFA